MSRRADPKGWDPIWPYFLGGVCSPLLGGALERWMPPAIAGGLGFFLAWVVVGVAFLIAPPTSKWTLGRWLLGGAAGALVGGLAVFMLQEYL